MPNLFSKLRFRKFKQDFQGTEVVNQEKVELVALDTFIIEFLWKFKAVSKELLMDDIACIFNEMLSRNNTNYSQSLKMRLIVKLAKAIVRENKYNISIDKKKCIKRLIAALYLVCYQHEINFHTIIADVIFDPSIDARERNKKDEIIPCNFASFADLITLEREYDIELDDIMEHVTNIWTEYFEELMEFFDEESVETVKRVEIFSDSDKWSKWFEEYVDEVECPSFEIANLLIKYFASDEMNIEIHYWILSSILCGKANISESEASKALSFIIQEMADYTKYQSIEFEMRDNWKVIIHAIIHKFDGITLNNISDIIIKSFNIPRKDVEDYIKEATFNYLASLEEVAICNPMKKINAIYKLLSNPTVFKVVSLTDNDIIRLFE